ncbi:radical SAM family heme chaperone HemW [Microbulbifer thermotolerans]|uniref:radical SAM family heme chaperone HemW n=1 Tax=Microbulbifer thermotolerans TaxID=252514 RepID=UPI00224976C7|nr:radical SAM family heme chaperone HemW [Microbulbifer thermotolerans]MCX2795610.1 radical SAM family heme chaperone HemW [Microbulbifer thermotolerans]
MTTGLNDSALRLPPLSLYVHIPWCVRKCPYCDFNSHAVATGVGGREADGGRSAYGLPEAAYVEQLRRDLQSQLPWVQGRRLCSIFFGGGTPSLFSPASIGEILETAEKMVGFAQDIEITLEANPGTFEQEKFSGYRAVGVNRLSIGVQSFDQRQLKNLGRIHTGEEAEAALGMARRAGFDNINLDLMHALPGQTEAQALADLERAVSLGPEHISWYQLTIEPNTAFYSAPPTVPGSGLVAAMQASGREYLAAQGYARYEVSAYSRAGMASRHNLNYWSFGDYLGIGAGAHGKVTLPDQERILRSRRTRAPHHYLTAASPDLIATGLAPPQSDPVAPEDLPLEFLMNALRLVGGVPSDSFSRYTGLPLTALKRQWPLLQAMDLVQPLEGHIAATPFGFDYLDEILQRFLEQC